MMYENVTLVITSCDRLDLLQLTIRSISSEILENLGQKIIVDDSTNSVCHIYLKNLYPDWTIICNKEKLGHPKSIDTAYELVETDYIFHCEDDWVFHNDKFLKQSLEVLEHNSDLFLVTFRIDSPQPSEPTIYNGDSSAAYQLIEQGWRGQWFGFTYNPCVLRKSTYDMVKPYAGNQEHEVGLKYYNLPYPFRAAHLCETCAEHIGDGRNTNPTGIV